MLLGSTDQWPCGPLTTWPWQDRGLSELLEPVQSRASPGGALV